MAIRFESKKDGSGASPDKGAKAGTRVEESLNYEVDAANAPEMPFAKPPPRPKSTKTTKGLKKLRSVDRPRQS
jgi:hypothetical protein